MKSTILETRKKIDDKHSDRFFCFSNWYEKNYKGRNLSIEQWERIINNMAKNATETAELISYLSYCVMKDRGWSYQMTNDWTETLANSIEGKLT